MWCILVKFRIPKTIIFLLAFPLFHFLLLVPEDHTLTLPMSQKSKFEPNYFVTFIKQQFINKRHKKIVDLGIIIIEHLNVCFCYK